jgi:hypothetical protein
MMPATNIVEALQHPRLFGALPAFKDLSTWDRWLVFLSAFYGLPLTDAQERIFCQHTGRSRYVPREGGYRRGVAICGRQSGKDRIGSVAQSYEAIKAIPQEDGTELFSLSIAQDHRASLRTAHRYARAPFEHIPALRDMVQSRRSDAWTLNNGIILAGYPCRPEAVRGIRSTFVVLSELAFFRSSENLPLDAEMLRAVTPTLATTGGRMLILSSPYAASGTLYELHRQFFGKDDAETLVWVGTAPEMNPTLPADYLAMMREHDPEGYAAEVLGEFRQGLSLLLDGAILDAAVDDDVFVRPYEPGRRYYAAYDASGGKSDAAALSIAHRDPDGTAVLDVCRVWPAPHDPIAVISEAVQQLRQFGLRVVTGDRYSGDFVTSAFRNDGITYRLSTRDRSQIYTDFSAIVHSGRVRLLDSPYLLRELRALERRRGAAGKDRVDHPAGAHDDAAVTTASACTLASEMKRPAPIGVAHIPQLI